MNASSVRDGFRLGVQGFLEVVQAIPSDSWDRPALGVWTVRDLAGHTSRALLTVEAYLDPSTTVDDPQIADTTAYYQASASGGRADPAAVAERGRQAGLALGEDPAGAVAAMAERVLPLVDASGDAACVRTPVGSMTLIGYLPSRTFELAVHSLDLRQATGRPVPAALGTPIAMSLHLAAELATARGQAAEVLVALTGRQELPPGFNVVG